MQESQQLHPFNLKARPKVLSVDIGFHGLGRHVERYRHEFWCLHLYRYEGELIANGRSLRLHPGLVTVFPPGTALEFRYPDSCSHVYAHFLAGRGAPRASLPEVHDLGSAFIDFSKRFEEAAAFARSEPVRRDVRIWDLLLELASLPSLAPLSVPRQHPALARALKIIELRLQKPLRVESLVRELGVSHTLLSRLFREETGLSIVSYIRMRRVQLAKHLLAQTASPIFTIAIQVGIPDPQRFNKIFRAECGISPSEYRSKHWEWKPRPLV